MGKKIWDFVTTTALVVMILLVGVIYVPKFFGVNPMIVLSGSMEPTYHVGSLLYVQNIEPEKVKVDDPITFYIDETTLVTHRVVDIDKEARTYTTKGDNNDIVDGSPVSFDNIMGKAVFNIPKLGYLADKLSAPAGKILYGTVAVVLIILIFMGDVLFSSKDKKEEKIEEKKEEKKDEKNLED